MSGDEVVLAFFVFGGDCWVLSPLARARGKRIASGAPPGTDAAVVPAPRTTGGDELRQVRQWVGGLAARLDFIAYWLTQRRDAERLAPRRR